jgi:hypothetical protein
MAGGELAQGGNERLDDMERAEQIIAQTPNNPHEREERLKDLQAAIRARDRGAKVIATTTATTATTKAAA